MPVRIVVVHDEPEFARPLTEALTDAGFEVTAFANPMHAFQALEAAESIVNGRGMALKILAAAGACCCAATSASRSAFGAATEKPWDCRLAGSVNF